ncbi:CPBP family intramembrane metalloprotease [Candidatus Saccharibacteria bacterium]|nr:CPBP family intramembrane metalloprotease [Candidatus Saccharibacteria bacterium]
MKEAPSKVPQTEVKPSAKTSPKRTFLIVALMMIWVFCSVVASQLLLGYLMLWILGGETITQPVWNGVYSVLSYALALVLIIFVPPRVNAKWKLTYTKKGRQVKTSGSKASAPITREQIGLSGTPTWTDIGLAPIAYIVGTLFAALLMLLFSLFPWFNPEQLQETGFTAYMSGGEKVIAFVVLVVLAPAIEEIIFRGWLYGKLRARINMPLSIILTSLLFAVMHFQWNVGVNVFALSVVLCVLREITGTIYAGILTHMIKNGVAFYLLYVLGM